MHYYLVQKWSAIYTINSDGEEEVHYLYCKDAHRENVKYIDGKLKCIDYGCLTTKRVDIHEYLRSVGLECDDLGVELVLYLSKDNVQQVDEILTTVQTYLRNTLIDFNSSDEPPAPVMDIDGDVQDLDDQVLLDTDEISINRNTARGGTSNIASTYKRAGYNTLLTQEQKEQINGGRLPLPEAELNTKFDGEVHLAPKCYSPNTCKPSVEKWWSDLSSNNRPQLISVKDFKAKVMICGSCSNSKNCPKILQSMSQFQGIQAKDGKNKIELFEIRKNVKYTVI